MININQVIEDMDLKGNPSEHRIVVAMSGGVDSSTVAGIMNIALTNPVWVLNARKKLRSTSPKKSVANTAAKLSNTNIRRENEKRRLMLAVAVAVVVNWTPILIPNQKKTKQPNKIQSLGVEF